ncbi:MAG: caspase family protein [Bacteroidia bacterium]|nr:caspase family protein [Bacteroidia bacterium]
MEDNRALNWKGKSPESQPLPGKNYLLIIGIDQYTQIPPLKNAVNDAQDFAEIMLEQYQFSPENCHRLLNGEATTRNIKDTFRKLAQTIQPEDSLVIFYSGHGTFDKVLDQGYWLPIDSGPDSTEKYISNAELITYLRAIRSFHTLVISDSCFSGTLFARTRNFSDRVEGIPSRWGIASGRNEPVSDGGGQSNSPFTENLLYFLRNNAGDTLPVSRLIQQVKEAVANNSDQTPQGSPLQDVGDKGGEFVFRKKGAVLPAPKVEMASERRQTASIPAQTLIVTSPAKTRSWNKPWVWLLLGAGMVIGLIWLFASLDDTPGSIFDEIPTEESLDQKRKDAQKQMANGLSGLDLGQPHLLHSVGADAWVNVEEETRLISAGERPAAGKFIFAALSDGSYKIHPETDPNVHLQVAGGMADGIRLRKNEDTDQHSFFLFEKLGENTFRIHPAWDLNLSLCTDSLGGHELKCRKEKGRYSEFVIK